MRLFTAACVLLALCAGISQAAPLMAVDLGGEFLKVSMVRAGSGFSVVINEMSKRRTSAQVSLVGGERLLGEDAAALAPRHPEQVFARSRDLLGRQAKDASTAQLAETYRLPYKLLAGKDRPTVAVADAKGTLYPAEVLVGSLLQYARGMAQAAAARQAIVDCVLVVPAFWGPPQRQAYIDAAKLAGLNVLALVNTHSAAAIQYGYDRDFAGGEQTVLLLDVGATSTEAALVRYSTFNTSSARTFGQFEVLDVAWDESAGVEALDFLLLDHFAQAFQAQHGSDPRPNSRALAKLRKQVKRTKEVLSANTGAPLSVEELLDGQDFRSHISRADFEALAGDAFQRIAAVPAALLARSGLSAAQLDAVEVLGGGSRIPAVQAAVSAALSGRPLDKHLDADEAVVLGAAKLAANLSTTFRPKNFGMADGAIYPIQLQWVKPKGEKLLPEATWQPKDLLPRLKRLPAKRMLAVPNITTDSLDFRLFFDDSEGPLPPGFSSPELGTFSVSGIKGILGKHKQGAKMSVHFRADLSGLLHPESADAAVEVVEEYEVKVPVKGPSGAGKDATANETDAASEPDQATAADSNDTAAAAPATETVKKTRRKVLKLPLKLGGPGFLRPGLTDAQRKAAKTQLDGLEAADAARQETARAKNDLEAFILAMQGRLADEDDELRPVSSEQQRDDVLASLSQAEDWLYFEGADEGASAYRQRLGKLKALVGPMLGRAAEASKRPRALEAARSFLELVGKSANAWEAIKPWVNHTQRLDLLTQVESLTGWLLGKESAQAALQGHEDPALHSSEVDSKVGEVRKEFNRLNAVKKPKPPPQKNGTNETNASADATAEAAAPGPVRLDDESIGKATRKDQEPLFDEDSSPAGDAEQPQTTQEGSDEL